MTDVVVVMRIASVEFLAAESGAVELGIRGIILGSRSTVGCTTLTLTFDKQDDQKLRALHEAYLAQNDLQLTLTPVVRA